MAFLKAVTTVGGFTLGSRVLGLIRDIIIASFLGAGASSDAFFIALKLPNFFRRITAEGAFSYSFVPMFSKMLGDKNNAKAFAEEAQAVMIATLLPFTIVAVVFMPWILYVIVPGITDEPVRYAYAIEFSRITFPYILMMSLTALLGGVMNSLNRFAAFAIAPMFFNISLIISTIFFSDILGSAAHALSWGVVISGVIQFLWMLYNAHKSGFALKFRVPIITPRIKKLFKLMIPGIIGAGAVQINMFIDMFLASMLPVGSISFLYYADRLYQLPLGVIGVAVSTALLPMLAKAIKKDNGSCKKLSSNAFEAAFALSLPAAIGLIVLAEPVITVLFERGEFVHSDTIQASKALIAYAFGIPAYVLARVFSTSFFAREDTKTPVKYAIISACINTVLAVILILPFKHVGIATSTAISAWFNLFMLVRKLKKRNQLALHEDVFIKLIKIFISAVVLGAVAWFGYNINTELNLIMQLISVIIIAKFAYFLSLYMLGVFNLSSIKDMFSAQGEVLNEEHFEN